VGLIIAIPKEKATNEKRVAASVESVKHFTKMGFLVRVESMAGHHAGVSDAMFVEAGAKISKTTTELVKNTNIILRVQPPSVSEIKTYPRGSLLVGVLAPHNNVELIKECAARGINAFSMDLVPRISRAQSMDVLSSQSNLAGYKAVLDACEHFSGALPMMMTAAGTISPSKVFVMGAGVAGLQAIATAKRLGAVVSATDVRPAAKEQVESLGGVFIAVEDEEFKNAETAGGYAKDMSAAYKKKQASLVAEHIAKQDIVITTALTPEGRPAPKLVNEDMVKSMAAGSVIIDLAAETGGNCDLTQPGSVVVKHDVSIIGHLNMPSRLARDSSALYAKNLLNLIILLFDSETQSIAVDWSDEIIQSIALTQDGKIVHSGFTNQAPSAKKTAQKKAKKAPSSQTVASKKAAAPVKKSVEKKTTQKKPMTKAKKTTNKTSSSKTAVKKNAPAKNVGSKGK